MEVVAQKPNNDSLPLIKLLQNELECTKVRGCNIFIKDNRVNKDPKFIAELFNEQLCLINKWKSTE